MKNGGKYAKILRAISGFLLYFLFTSFIVSCSLMLFLTVFAGTLGIELTENMIAPAAKITLLNVIFISLLFTVFDLIRRKLTVTNPSRMIKDTADRITQGDFSARTDIKDSYFISEEFCEIADRLNTMARELENTSTLRTDFIANVSHEIRTPLSVIRNYAEILSHDGLGDEERHDYLAIIRDTSTKLAELVGNILRLNKLENSEIKPSFTKFDLSELVTECLFGFDDNIEAKRLTVVANIEDGVTVKSDAELLSLALNNLISNAVKFTDDGGSIGISLKRKGEYAEITVSDTGCGIPSDDAGRIFDKFYQADTSRAKEGNGLGLALVKKVIDITSSSITVTSKLGEGTSFTIKIKGVSDAKA
ncbi:MAG: HAMP domain-containing histidine kinase [Clostridia bacterium]|nr:HAMP domain-containing histidine kinase [Clostridia bacterium]